MKKILVALITTLLFSSISSSVVAQSMQTEFGKNRVQYHDFEWWQYETQNFMVFWYAGGRNLGQTVVTLAEMDYEEIRGLLEYRINEKIEILVYNDLTDLKQSNIGNDEIFINTGGITKIVENKLFVYNDGNLHNLRRQIRQGITQVYLNYMMFGGNIQEIVQNAVLMNLPPWYTEGLVSYVGEEWNTEIDNKLRDGILSGRYQSFQDVVEDDPRLAGHSFWYFIGHNYGKATVSNLLYLTRINRSVESGFLYVLGGSLNQMQINWYNFYQQLYSSEVNLGDIPDEANLVLIKNKKKLPFTELKLNPRATKLAYVTNEIGKAKVYVQDLKEGTREQIFKFGSKNEFQEADYNYPLLSWANNGKQLAIAYEKRDVIYVNIYNTENKKENVVEIPAEYERIIDIDFINSRDLLFTAIKNGYSNLYIFDTKTRQTKELTRDVYDDLDATYVTINNKKGVIFASNRPDSANIKGVRLDSVLPQLTYDLYYLDLEEKGKQVDLVRLTNTPYANERMPMQVDSTHFAFISNNNGIQNRYIGYIDTVFAYKEKVVLIKGETEPILLPPDSIPEIDPVNIDTMYVRDVFKPKGFAYANTNYIRNLESQHVASRKGQVGELIYKDGEYQYYLQDLVIDNKANQITSSYQKLQERRREREEAKEKNKIVFKTDTQPKTNPTVIPAKKDTTPVVLPKETPKEKLDTGKIDIDNYFFQSEFEDNQPVEPEPEVVVEEVDGGVTVQRVLQEAVASEQPLHEFRPSRIIPYRLRFKTDYVTTQMDNSLIYNSLQPINPNDPFFDYPIPSILLIGSAKDVLEDYRLEGGVRVPTTFNGIEYFVSYYDNKKRLDKKYSFYRRMRRGSNNLQVTASPLPGIAPTTFTYDATYKILSNIAEVQVRYPLDIFQSLRATATGRTDRLLYLGTDYVGLQLPDNTQQRVGLRLEYVFDNSMDIATNIKHGSRAKAYAEVQKRFDLSLDDGVSLSFNEGMMGILGVDARHYQELDRHSILAFRLSAASSFGSEKILYFLGGVENWLIPRFNNQIPLPDTEGFAYQTVVNNMRGFRSNIRNGNSFALINSELRVPVVKYFASNNVRSNFLRNLQLVGFFDVGTAWQGLSPFNDDNPLNTIEIENPNSPVSVTVNYFRNPVVAGYGFGMRSVLFGYFIKLDYAWGIETGVVQDPMIYLSLGLDF